MHQSIGIKLQALTCERIKSSCGFHDVLHKEKRVGRGHGEVTAERQRPNFIGWLLHKFGAIGICEIEHQMSVKSSGQPMFWVGSPCRLVLKPRSAVSKETTTEFAWCFEWTLEINLMLLFLKVILETGWTVTCKTPGSKVNLLSILGKSR